MLIRVIVRDDQMSELIKQTKRAVFKHVFSYVRHDDAVETLYNSRFLVAFIGEMLDSVMSHKICE